MAIDIYQDRRTDMHASISSEGPKLDVQQRRVEVIINEFDRVGKQADELCDRISALLDRTNGSRPQATENTSAPQPVPNGHLEALEAAIRRISNAHEHIRSELGALENIL